MHSAWKLGEHSEDKSAQTALQNQHLSDRTHQNKKRKLATTESSASTPDRLAGPPSQSEEERHIAAAQKSSMTTSDHPTLQKSHCSTDQSIFQASKTLSAPQKVEHDQRQGAEAHSPENHSHQFRNVVDFSINNSFDSSSANTDKTHKPQGWFNFLKRVSNMMTGSGLGLTGQPCNMGDDSPTKDMPGYFSQSGSNNEDTRAELKCSHNVAYELSRIIWIKNQKIQAYETELEDIHKKQQANYADLQQAHLDAEVQKKEKEKLHLRIIDKETENERLGRTLQASEKKVAKLKAMLHDLGVELAEMRGAYATSLREEQERSFKNIGPGGWLPEEESKVKGHLDRLKRMMKSWAKEHGAQGMLNPAAIESPEYISLRQALSKVVLTTNGKFPRAIHKNTKLLSLLLNALLAHDIYTNIVGNPFFIYSEGHAVSSPSKENSVLSSMYEKMKATNEREAHLWRAQTLRLLQPSKLSTNEAEQAQRDSTVQLVAQTSHFHATRFLNSQAMLLVGRRVDRNTCEQQLATIFQQAGEMAYGLWTRRNNMECYADINECYGGFNNNFMDLHTLVQWDDDSAKLNGKEVSVLVHPLLVASGNDDGEGYDEERVWSPAVALVDI